MNDRNLLNWFSHWFSHSSLKFKLNFVLFIFALLTAGSSVTTFLIYNKSRNASEHLFAANVQRAQNALSLVAGEMCPFTLLDEVQAICFIITIRAVVDSVTSLFGVHAMLVGTLELVGSAYL